MAAGSPGLTLLKVCVAEKSDVIVMGTLGRGNSRFIGSVALDTSFLIVLVAVYLLQILNRSIFLS